MALLLGSMCGIFLLSSLIGFIFFRKVKKPKKNYLSILIGWALATIIGGYGLAEGGGEPQFASAGIQYGLASAILLGLHGIIGLFKGRNSI